MRYFKVYNDQSGLDLGLFCGDDADEAIRLMLDDEAADATLKAVEVDAATVSDKDKAELDALRARHGWT